MLPLISGTDGGYNHSNEDDISDRIKSAVPPWYNGVVVKAAVGDAGGRHGKYKVAAAWVCGIGFGRPVEVPDVWWTYAIVEPAIPAGVIYRLAVCDTGVSSKV